MFYLSPICCVCVKERDNLLGLNNEADEKQEFLEKYIYCTYGIDNLVHDIPKFICNNCTNNLNAAYTFKKSCEAGNAKLNAYISQLKRDSSFNANIRRSPIKKHVSKHNSSLYSDIQILISRNCNTSDSPLKHINDMICSTKSPKSKSEPNSYSFVVQNEIENLLKEAKILVGLTQKNDYCNTPSVEDTQPQNVSNLSSTSCDPAMFLSIVMKEELNTSLIQVDDFNAKANKLPDPDKYSMMPNNNNLPLCSNQFDQIPIQTCETINFEGTEVCDDNNEELVSEDSDITCSCSCDESEDSDGSDDNEMSSREKNKTRMQHKEVKLQKTKDKPFCCNICGKAFKTKAKVKEHMQTHLDNRKKPHKCNICEKGFLKPSHLKIHMESVHKTVHRCHLCKQAFKTEFELKLHSAKEHPDELIYECDICGKSFSVLKCYNDHKLTHEGGNPFKCTLCTEGFENRNRLRQHRKLVHNTGKNKHKCVNCGESFARKILLDDHMEMHDTESSHKCLFCEETFTSINVLKSHLKTHEEGTGTSYRCKQCGKRYVRYLTYKNHMLTHEKGGKSLQCMYCEKTFKWRGSLDRHLKANHASKLFSCLTCKRDYKEKENLDKHIRQTNHVAKQSVDVDADQTTDSE